MSLTPRIFSGTWHKYCDIEALFWAESGVIISNFSPTSGVYPRHCRPKPVGVRTSLVSSLQKTCQITNKVLSNEHEAAVLNLLGPDIP